MSYARRREQGWDGAGSRGDGQGVAYTHGQGGALSVAPDAFFRRIANARHLR
jgi:hypothetical protein